MVRAAKLTTDLEARDATFTKTLRRAEKSLTRFEKSIRQSRRELRQLGRTFGTVIGAEVFRRAVTSQLQFADSLSKTARQLGGTTEFLSETAFAAKLVGVETRTLTVGLQRMTRRIAEAAAGSSEFGKAFDALGLSAAELRDQDLEKQFEAILRAMRGVNSEAERVRIAQKIFDSEGVTIARLADNFDQLRGSAKAAGATITTQFGRMAEEMNDRVATAIERLNSGLRKGIDLTFQFASGLGIVAARTIGIGELDAFDRKITELEGRLRLLRAPSGIGKGIGGGDEADIAEIEAQIARLKAEQLEFLTQVPDTPLPQTYETISQSLEKVETNGRKAKEVLTTLPDVVIGPGQRSIEEQMAGASVTVEELSSRVIGAQQEFSRLPIEAEQAARNIQSHFADFLFDPFDEGLRGMLRGFVDTLRRMAAELLASRLLGLLFPGGSLAGVLAGVGSTPTQPPGRALGGPVSALSPYIVGERGPELFVPAVNGRIEPGGGHGSINVTNNIDARGADASLARVLPAILERNREQTRSEILTLLRQRRIT